MNRRSVWAIHTCTSMDCAVWAIHTCTSMDCAVWAIHTCTSMDCAVWAIHTCTSMDCVYIFKEIRYIKHSRESSVEYTASLY